jgi:hypothetical protein
MGVEFEAEFVTGERRKFAPGGPGPSAAGVETDDLPFEDSIQNPVLPIAREWSEEAGINPFDEEPPSPAVAKEQAARPSANTLERLGPKVLPSLLAEINIHYDNYSKMEVLMEKQWINCLNLLAFSAGHSRMAASRLSCPNHEAVALLEKKKGVQPG